METKQSLFCVSLCMSLFGARLPLPEFTLGINKIKPKTVTSRIQWGTHEFEAPAWNIMLGLFLSYTRFLEIM